MSEHQILPAIPKKSTTSYCTTGSGGITPERTDDAVKRRDTLARLTAPTPQQVNANRWEQWNREWAERDKKYEADKLRQQQQIRANEKARADLALKDLEQKKRAADYRLRERIVDIALDTLTREEKGLAYQQLVDEGRVLDSARASAVAMEIVAKRS